MRPRPGVVVDWFRVIVALNQRARLTTAQIGQQIGVPKTTILLWKQGGEPRHSDGERLLALWCYAMVQDRAAVPVIERYSPVR